jgi:hypothetical protein
MKRETDTAAAAAMGMTAMGFAHGFAMHAPSLLWATRVRSADCALITENLVCYALLQIVAINLLAVAVAPDDADAPWIAGAYFALYYAWHMYGVVSPRREGTLAPHALCLSMALFATVTAPYMLYRHARENRLRNHFFGLLGAEAVDELVVRSLSRPLLLRKQRAK